MARGTSRRLAKALAEAEALRAEKEKQAEPPEPEPEPLPAEPEVVEPPAAEQPEDPEPAPEPPPKREGIKALAYECAQELTNIQDSKPYHHEPISQFLAWIRQYVFSFGEMSQETEAFLKYAFWNRVGTLRNKVGIFYTQCLPLSNPELDVSTIKHSADLPHLIKTFLKLADPS